MPMNAAGTWFRFDPNDKGEAYHTQIQRDREVELARSNARVERANDLWDAGIFLHESTPPAELDQDLFRADLFMAIQDQLLDNLLSAPFFVTDSFAS